MRGLWPPPPVETPGGMRRGGGYGYRPRGVELTSRHAMVWGAIFGIAYLVGLPGGAGVMVAGTVIGAVITRLIVVYWPGLLAGVVLAVAVLLVLASRGGGTPTPGPKPTPATSTSSTTTTPVGGGSR